MVEACSVISIATPQDSRYEAFQMQHLPPAAQQLCGVDN